MRARPARRGGNISICGNTAVGNAPDHRTNAGAEIRHRHLVPSAGGSRAKFVCFSRDSIVDTRISERFLQMSNLRLAVRNLVKDAVRDGGRHFIGGPRNWRELRDFFALQSDTLASAAGARAEPPCEFHLSRTTKRLDLLRPGRRMRRRLQLSDVPGPRARADRFSQVSPPITRSAPASRGKGRRTAVAKACLFRAATFRCSGCSPHSAVCWLSTMTGTKPTAMLPC